MKKHVFARTAFLTLLFASLACSTISINLPADQNSPGLSTGIQNIESAQSEEGVDPSGANPSSGSWEAVIAAIDQSDFAEITVIVGNTDGNVFSYSKGSSTPNKVYPLASASKWLSSATIMRLVEAGVLSLDDHPQDYIPWWTDDPGDPRSQVTLAQLLSFTSGFNIGAYERSCVFEADTTLDACGRQLYENNFEFAPGAKFYYGPAHLHTAALMAEYATGKDYNALFQEQIVQPLGMSSASGFYIPSTQNPRASAGASSTANDYARFLHATLSGSILSDSFAMMTADHTPTGAVNIISSPITQLGYEWHYGFGLWRECLADTWQPECDDKMIVSSLGAFGWYPWIDMEDGYYGLIAVQEKMSAGGQKPTEKSVTFRNAIRPLIAEALAQGGTSIQTGGQGNNPGGENKDRPPAPQNQGSPGQNGQQPPSIDFASAAAELGVTEEALRNALGAPGQAPPDFAAVAAELGVTEQALLAALGITPGGRP